MALPSKYCSLKLNQQFFTFYENQASSCCKSYSEVLDKTKPLKFLQNKWSHELQLLEQGVEVENCKLCWQHESRGQVSFRMSHGQSNTGPEFILSFSNLCNHMCSYCTPKYSSRWENDIIKNGNYQNISATASKNLTLPKQQQIDVDYWVDQLNDYFAMHDPGSIKLMLQGGEPLMQVNNIKRLLEFNLDKIKKFLIVTNLNPPNNKFLFWILENFPREKLEFTVSLDSSPEYMHIPRAGFDQCLFDQNIKLLQDYKIPFGFNSVISVVGIFDLKNFFCYLHSTGAKTNFTQLSSPDCLNPIYLPPEFKEKIKQTVNITEMPEIFQKILDSNSQNQLKLFEQYNYLDQYFYRAGIDPVNNSNELFAEYWLWLMNFAKNKL